MFLFQNVFCEAFRVLILSFTSIHIFYNRKSTRFLFSQYLLILKNNRFHFLWICSLTYHEMSITTLKPKCILLHSSKFQFCYFCWHFVRAISNFISPRGRSSVACHQSCFSPRAEHVFSDWDGFPVNKHCNIFQSVDGKLT